MVGSRKTLGAVLAPSRSLVDQLGRTLASVAAGLHLLQPADTVARKRPDPVAPADQTSDRPSPRLGSVVVSFAGQELRLLRFAGRRVVDWDRAPLPNGAMRSGVVFDPPPIAEVVQETFANLAWSRRGIVAALGARDARAAFLDLTWVKERDVSEVVADEAVRKLDITLESHYVFWQRVSSRRQERAVFVVAVPREPLLATLEACESGGLSLASVDLVPLALARAANQRDAVVVSVETDGLEVVAVADDLPVLMHGVPLTLHSTPMEIAAEVGRALAAYEDAEPARPIAPNAPLYLAGLVGGERAGELSAALGARTGYLAARSNPPMHFPTGFPLAEQMVNVGLALKER